VFIEKPKLPTLLVSEAIGRGSLPGRTLIPLFLAIVNRRGSGQNLGRLPLSPRIIEVLYLSINFLTILPLIPNHLPTPHGIIDRPPFSYTLAMDSNIDLPSLIFFGYQQRVPQDLLKTLSASRQLYIVSFLNQLI